MANSVQTHSGNGSTTTFSWAQIDGYLSTTHLYVYVNRVLKTLTSDYTLNTTAKTITFTAGNTPATGDYVEIKRITPKTVSGLQVTFTDASVLTAADMNTAQKQQLFIAQEAQDTGSGGMALGSDGASWDATKLRISRVDYPLNDDDVVPKTYVDTIALFGAFTIPQSWVFSGTGAKANFDLVSPAPTCTNPAMFLVEVNGVLQRPTTNYGIGLSGSTYQLQFQGNPAAGTNNIIVRNFGVARNALDVLPNSSVTAQYIATGAVETAKILDANVTAAKLAADSVTTAKILDANVTAAKLASDSVTTAKILDANVTAAKLATDAVTTAKIAALSVTVDKIAANAVDSTKIAANAVSYTQLKATGFTAAGSGTYRILHADASGNLNITNIGTALAAQPISSLAAPTANVAFGSFRITSIADGSAANDAVSFQQMNAQDIGYSGASASNVDYNLGTTIPVNVGTTTTARNATATIRLATGNTYEFTTAGAGTALTGTWACRGKCGIDGTAVYQLFQRIS